MCCSQPREQGIYSITLKDPSSLSLPNSPGRSLPLANKHKILCLYIAHKLFQMAFVESHVETCFQDDGRLQGKCAGSSSPEEMLLSLL